jgi:hypothetical protein
VSSKIERSHKSTCDGRSIPILDLVNLHGERKYFIIEEFRNPSKDERFFFLCFLMVSNNSSLYTSMPNLI